MAKSQRAFNSTYSGEFLNYTAFPLGGIGSGTICLEGSGTLSHISILNRPEVFNEPPIFAAISLKSDPGSARVLQGPVPDWKTFRRPDAGNGLTHYTYGLPRFDRATFSARFPFATVAMEDDQLPLTV